MDNNAYLLRCRSTGEGLLIDAANEADRLLDLSATRRSATVSPPTGTATTGRRCAEVVERHRRPDGRARRGRDGHAGAGRPSRSRTGTGHGRRRPTLTVIHLRGPHPGLDRAALPTTRTGPPHLFTGDSLFPGGAGQHRGPAAASPRCWTTWRRRSSARLPTTTWVYPGHGNDTTLGAERPQLAGVARPRLVTVRPARADEAPAISALRCARRSRGYDPAFLDACRDDLTIDPAWCDGVRLVVAEEAGTLLGYARVAGGPPVGELAGLFVDPSAIGRGVGGVLLRHAVAIAARLGMTALEIDSDPNAEPFYRQPAPCAPASPRAPSTRPASSPPRAGRAGRQAGLVSGVRGCVPVPGDPGGVRQGGGAADTGVVSAATTPVVVRARGNRCEDF